MGKSTFSTGPFSSSQTVNVYRRVTILDGWHHYTTFHRAALHPKSWWFFYAATRGVPGLGVLPIIKGKHPAGCSVNTRINIPTLINIIQSQPSSLSRKLSQTWFKGETFGNPLYNVCISYIYMYNMLGFAVSGLPSTKQKNKNRFRFPSKSDILPHWLVGDDSYDFSTWGWHPTHGFQPVCDSAFFEFSKGRPAKPLSFSSVRSMSRV